MSSVGELKWDLDYTSLGDYPTRSLLLNVSLAMNSEDTGYPLHLVMVCDCSKSAIKHFKKACLATARSMDEEDSLHVVVFTKQGAQLVPIKVANTLDFNRKAINDLDSEIEAEIVEAWKTSRFYLMQRPKPCILNIALITDGACKRTNVNQAKLMTAVQDGFEIDNIQTSSYAWGKTYDETTMLEVARLSSGWFHHLKDGDQLEATLLKESERLRSIVMPNVRLLFRCSSKVKFFDQISDYHLVVNGNVITVHLGSMVAEDRIEPLFQLTLSEDLKYSSEDIHNLVDIRVLAGDMLDAPAQWVSIPYQQGEAQRDFSFAANYYARKSAQEGGRVVSMIENGELERAHQLIRDTLDSLKKEDRGSDAEKLFKLLHAEVPKNRKDILAWKKKHKRHTLFELAKLQRYESLLIDESHANPLFFFDQFVRD